MEILLGLLSTEMISKVLPLVIGGAVLPAVAAVLAKVLNMGPIREFLGGVFYAWGSWTSLTLGRAMGSAWNDLENSIQELVTFCVKKLFAGLDKDDTYRDSDYRKLDSAGKKEV